MFSSHNSSPSVTRSFNLFSSRYFRFLLVLAVFLCLYPGARIDTFATTLIVPLGGDFQAALNVSQPGDTIILQAGATYIGPFILPVKSGSSFVTIQSSSLSLLPAPGVRVTPANASAMPKLVSAGSGSPVVQTVPSAHHFCFVGIEFTLLDANAFVYDLIMLGNGTTAQNSLTQVPHHFVFDRCYIHGLPNIHVKRGISVNSAYTDILNSYISEIKEVGTDTQAICGWNGPGPFRIINNYLEAAGENILFGGADIPIPNLVPSDIEIRQNYITKQLSWRIGDPSYAGTHWSVKNLFELKNAQRVTFDGNVLEYNWGDGQDGSAMLITPRNQSGAAPWTVVQDVQITNNVVRHSGNGLQILGHDTYNLSLPSKRITIDNNLFVDIDGATWNSAGKFAVIGGGGDQIIFNHNTVFQSGNIMSIYGDPTTNFVFNNNLLPHNVYGIIGDGGTAGLATLSLYMPGAVMNRTVIAGAGIAPYYPANNFFPTILESVQFTDRTNGNYRLAASSPYKNLGTDGKDPGCDFDQLNAAMGGSQPSPPPTPTPTPTPTATPTPMPTPMPTTNLGRQVGLAKHNGQILANQLSSTISPTGLSSSPDGSIMDSSTTTAIGEFVSDIQQACAVYNDEGAVLPAAARINDAQQAALAAAGHANQAATQGDLAGVKSYLRQAITYLALSEVLITYGDVANPIDFAPYMVRQQYIDFLDREPDQSGNDFWVNEIVSCVSDANCVAAKRINVSASFFLSIEFQQTGYYVYRLYKSSYGRVPTLQEFLPDNVSIANGVIVGADGWEARLAGNKQAFVQGWVQRSDFQARYAGLTNDQYVDTLIANGGVTITPAERNDLVQDLVNGKPRADVLAKLVDNPTVSRGEFNSAFVLMQYFGYLGRDPDSAGFNFWLSKLNQFNGDFAQAEMVRAFLDSGEYRQRFGQ
jgi:hypothetical protein